MQIMERPKGRAEQVKRVVASELPSPLIRWIDVVHRRTNTVVLSCSFYNGEFSKYVNAYIQY